MSSPPSGIASRAFTARLSEHLLELVRVGVHGVQRRLERRDELEVLADQPRQHRRDALDDVVELEDARLQYLAAAESEQLARQDRGAFCRGRDLVELGLGGAVAAFEQALGVAADHGQEIVEVVGDAAGEPADRLEPLGLAQLLLELLALADVAADRLGSDRDAVLEDQPARDLDLDPASVLGYELALVDRRRLGVGQLPVAGGDRLSALVPRDECSCRSGSRPSPPGCSRARGGTPR